jgi:hypothetical protein
MSARRTNRRPTVVAKPPPTAVEQSNRLAFLLEEIKTFEVLASRHGKAAMMARLDEGDRLHELKASVDHGQWLRRLKELGINQMRAWRYMKLAEHRPLVEAKLNTEFDLGLNGALDLIYAHEEQKKREADKQYQKAKQEREQDNRRRLAVEMKRRAKHDAKLKRLADAQRERERLSGLGRAAAEFCRIGAMAQNSVKALTNQTDRRAHQILAHAESVILKEGDRGKRFALFADVERGFRDLRFRLFALETSADADR